MECTPYNPFNEQAMRKFAQDGDIGIQGVLNPEERLEDDNYRAALRGYVMTLADIEFLDDSAGKFGGFQQKLSDLLSGAYEHDESSIRDIKDTVLTESGGKKTIFSLSDVSIKEHYLRTMNYFAFLLRIASHSNEKSIIEVIDIACENGIIKRDAVTELQGNIKLMLLLKALNSLSNEPKTDFLTRTKLREFASMLGINWRSLRKEVIKSINNTNEIYREALNNRKLQN